MSYFSRLKNSCYDALANVRNRHVEMGPVSHNARVRIFVVQHFDCLLPDVFANRSVYIPLMCGKSARPDGGMLADNTGVNISRYNPFLNEMTGIYWVAKNPECRKDADYVGFNHYRRALEWSPEQLSPRTIVATSVFFHRLIRARICFNLNPERRNFLLQSLIDKTVELGAGEFSTYLDSHTMYPYNMFVMSREAFDGYVEFVEPYIEWMIGLIDSNVTGIQSESPSEKRIFGYLLEHLTSFWIYRERKSRAMRIDTTFIRNYRVD